jgi:hypothetical protein
MGDELIDRLQSEGIEATKTTFFDDIAREMREDPEIQARIDAIDAKAARDWAILAYQVVGHEVIPEDYMRKP